MGWIKHNYFIVTHYNLDEISAARDCAIKTFNLDVFPREVNLVSEILGSVSNSYFSFFVNCDGSKEGWDTSDMYDKIRSNFTQYLIEKSIHFVEVSMDTDNEVTRVEEASSGSVVKLRPYHEHESY